jgi:hypothetical protein
VPLEVNFVSKRKGVRTENNCAKSQKDTVGSVARFELINEI